MEEEAARDMVFLTEQRRKAVRDFLQRVFERTRDRRADVDLLSLARLHRITVDDAMRTVESCLRREVDRQKSGMTQQEAALASASLHTILVEDIARWERSLQTCARGSVCHAK